jgi:hypothetical protein
VDPWTKPLQQKTPFRLFPLLVGRAVSFYKTEEFVKLIGEKSLPCCDGIITIAAQQIDGDHSHKGEIRGSMTLRNR